MHPKCFILCFLQVGFCHWTVAKEAHSVKEHTRKVRMCGLTCQRLQRRWRKTRRSFCGWWKVRRKWFSTREALTGQWHKHHEWIYILRFYLFIDWLIADFLTLGVPLDLSGPQVMRDLAFPQWSARVSAPSCGTMCSRLTHSSRIPLCPPTPLPAPSPSWRRSDGGSKRKRWSLQLYNPSKGWWTDVPLEFFLPGPTKEEASAPFLSPQSFSLCLSASWDWSLSNPWIYLIPQVCDGGDPEGSDCCQTCPVPFDQRGACCFWQRAVWARVSPLCPATHFFISRFQTETDFSSHFHHCEIIALCFDLKSRSRSTTLFRIIMYQYHTLCFYILSCFSCIYLCGDK